MNPPLALGALAGIAGFHLARAAVREDAAFRRHIGAPLKLRRVDFSALMLLQANPGCTPKQLAAALCITAPQLSLLVDALAQRGLCRRAPHPSDGRSQQLHLTDKGLRLADKAAAAAALLAAPQPERLSAAEQAMLIELLGKMAPG